MRRQWLLVLAVLGLVLGAVPAQATNGTGTSASDTPVSETAIWTVRTGEQTWGQALVAGAADQAAKNPQAWVATLRATADQSSTRPSDSESQADAAAMREAATLIASGTTTSAPLREVAVDLDKTIADLRADEASIAAAQAALVSTFGIRGGAIANKRAWQFYEILEGLRCSPICQVVDRFTVRFTINPGGVSSRIDHNVTYFPSTGGFRSVTGARYALCGGTVACGSYRAVMPQAGAGYVVVGNNPSQKGKNLKHRISITSYYLPSGQTARDEADTGLAFCTASTSSNVCTYN